VREFEVMLDDNRFLDCVEAGDPDGAPLLFHNGTPGSRLLSASWHRVAAEAGWRLLSFSRAGYGTSSPKPGRTVADVAADSAAVLDHCGAGRFAVWGHSGGGPHALACAALLADRVTTCVSSAGVAPYDADGLDWLAGMGEANIEEFGMLAQGREASLAVHLAATWRDVDVPADLVWLREAVDPALAPRTAAVLPSLISPEGTSVPAAPERPRRDTGTGSSTSAPPS